MINNSHSIRVRKYAAREMIYNNSQHAIYGVSYVNTHGNVVEELAETPSKIKYFYSDDSYTNCVNAIQQCYDDANVLNIAYALQEKMDYKNQIAKEVQ